PWEARSESRTPPDQMSQMTGPLILVRSTMPRGPGPELMGSPGEHDDRLGPTSDPNRPTGHAGDARLLGVAHRPGVPPAGDVQVRGLVPGRPAWAGPLAQLAHGHLRPHRRLGG